MQCLQDNKLKGRCGNNANKTSEYQRKHLSEYCKNEADLIWSSHHHPEVALCPLQWRHMSVMGSQIPSSWMYIQKLLRMTITMHHWAFVSGIHLWQLNSPQRGQSCGKCLQAMVSASIILVQTVRSMYTLCPYDCLYSLIHKRMFLKNCLVSISRLK